jgi:hypothetical protein
MFPWFKEDIRHLYFAILCRACCLAVFWTSVCADTIFAKCTDHDAECITLVQWSSEYLTSETCFSGAKHPAATHDSSGRLYQRQCNSTHSAIGQYGSYFASQHCTATSPSECSSY